MEQADVQKALVKYGTEINMPAIAIRNDAEYFGVTDQLRRVKGAMAAMKDLKETATKPLDEARKAILAMFRPYEDAAKEKEISIKRAIVAWSNEQERLRLELEAKMRDEQAKLQEKAEAKAEKLEARGKIEEAEAIRERTYAIGMPIAEEVKAEGVHTRKTWAFKIVDSDALFASGRREFWEPNEKSLRSFAKATKGLVNVPGVEFYQEVGVSASAVY